MGQRMLGRFGKTQARPVVSHADGESSPDRTHDERELMVGPKHESYDIDRIRLRVWTASFGVLGAALGALVATLQKAEGLAILGWMAGFGVVVGAATWFGSSWLVDVAGRTAGRIFMPAARGTAHPDYSLQQALVASGDVAGAIRTYESLAETAPTVTVLLRLADLHGGAGGDPDRAIALYRRARELPHCSRDQDRYATNRLIDLYPRVSGKERRALSELRRLAEVHGDSREGKEALNALARLKAELESR